MSMDSQKRTNSLDASKSVYATWAVYELKNESVQLIAQLREGLPLKLASLLCDLHSVSQCRT